MAAALEAGTIAVRVIAMDKPVLDSIKRVQGGFNGMARTIMDSFVTASSALVSIRAAIQPLANTASIFAGFESGMSKVQAITGATADQLTKLTEQAKALGKNTFFTASQVAEAQKFLGMAGFNPEQILAATPGMLDLALAGDMDLGMAADIATNISTPFGIAAERISEVNDVLAKAATSSNTNIQEMGQAFKYAAPAAAAAGQSIEECAAAMAILANNGIKADMAGTSVRMMLIKLADAGIQTKLKEQFDVDVTDAAGKIRPLISVLQEMQSKMSGMTDTQKLATFYDIFEARAGTAAIVLANSGDAAAEYRLKMMDAAGTTAEMARIMGDNLKGDWVSFMSVVEAVQIAFGSATGEMARNVLQFAASAARGIAEFVNANQTLISTLAYVGGAFAVYKAGGTALTVLKSAFVSMVPAASAATAANVANTVAENANTAAVAANTVAKNANIAATATNTVATTAMTTATTRSTVAMNTLKASMAAHPLLWIVGAAVATSAFSSYLQKAVVDAKELNNAMSQRRENNDTERAADEKKMKRLQQLAEQQRLSNAEMKEAETLAGQLESKYGDLGVTMDSMSNSFQMAADSMQNFMDVLRQKAIQDYENELEEVDKNLKQLEKEAENINSYANWWVSPIWG
ncbi:MAG: phage tail tape measure protein, partial [Planctomycetaceae bacterium]|nr:phage tail tape measure protein [Planctomycetaceae bacterium]